MHPPPSFESVTCSSTNAFFSSLLILLKAGFSMVTTDSADPLAAIWLSCRLGGPVKPSRRGRRFLHHRRPPRTPRERDARNIVEMSGSSTAPISEATVQVGLRLCALCPWAGTIFRQILTRTSVDVFVEPSICV